MTELEKYKLFATLVNYDEHSGVFIWKVDSYKGVSVIGKRAGVTSTNKKFPGRIISRKFNGKRIYVLSRRLAYFMINGALPTGNITTKNGDKFDDRFENLEVGKCTSHKRKSVKGIYFLKQKNVWQAQVYANGIRHTEYFDNKLDAEVWVIEKRNTLGFNGALHGRVE